MGFGLTLAANELFAFSASEKVRVEIGVITTL